MTIFRFANPPVWFGAGVVRTLPERLAEFGARRPLIVTDKGLVASGVVERVSAALQQADIQTHGYDEVEPNPTLVGVEEGIKRFHEWGADGIIAVGGGSSIDTGKVMAACIGQGRSPLEIDPQPTSGNSKGTPVPVLALPTTAGTGSEVTAAAVIRDVKGNRKIVYRGLHVQVKAAICDPELTLSLPRRQTIATGIDALTQSIGSYTNVSYHPIAELYALESIRRVAANLPKVVEDPGDLEARTHMLLGSLLGGLAISNTGNDIVHGMSTPVEGHFGTVHGEALAVLLPKCVEFNVAAAPERYAAVAEAMNCCDPSASVPEKANSVASAIETLLRELGAPTRLRDLGVDRERFAVMAAEAEKSRSTQLNCRPATKEDIVAIYAACW